eukprot:6226667-Pyramimonas_sp.AAC.1
MQRSMHCSRLFLIRIDDVGDGRSPDQGKGSSAQPMLASPEGLGMARHAREPAGTTPLPQMKKRKNDDDDLSASPLPEGFTDQTSH